MERPVSVPLPFWEGAPGRGEGSWEGGIGGAAECGHSPLGSVGMPVLGRDPPVAISSGSGQQGCEVQGQG